MTQPPGGSPSRTGNSPRSACGTDSSPGGTEEEHLGSEEFAGEDVAFGEADDPFDVEGGDHLSVQHQVAEPREESFGVFWTTSPKRSRSLSQSLSLRW